MVTITENQQHRLKNKIQKYFVSTSPYLEKGICPTKELLATTLDKWSLFCIMHLGYYETLRFNELKKRIEGISSRMLTVTLKKLENMDVVSRTVYNTSPPKVEYSLTNFGLELTDKIVNLSNWFIKNSISLNTPTS